MSSSTVTANNPREPIAPWWQTVLVMIPIAIGSVASAYQHGLPNVNVPGMNSRLSSYLTVMAVELVPVYLIWLACKRRGLTLDNLVSGRWQTRRAFFRDLGLAVGFMVVAVAVVTGLSHLLGGIAENIVANIMPRTGLELVAWLVMAVTGGVCEEIVFRGFLTRQFDAWTRSARLAIVLQGLAFGLAHGYYHRIMAVVAVQGWLLGLLAYWRKSLRPGILAHVLQDSIGGVVAFITLK